MFLNGQWRRGYSVLNHFTQTRRVNLALFSYSPDKTVLNIDQDALQHGADFRSHFLAGKIFRAFEFLKLKELRLDFQFCHHSFVKANFGHQSVDEQAGIRIEVNLVGG